MATKKKTPPSRSTSRRPDVKTTEPGRSSPPRTSARPTVPSRAGQNRPATQSRPTQPRTPRPEGTSRPTTRNSGLGQRVGETQREYDRRVAEIKGKRYDSDKAEFRTDPTRARARSRLNQKEVGSPDLRRPNPGYSNRRGGK